MLRQNYIYDRIFRKSREKTDASVAFEDSMEFVDEKTETSNNQAENCGKFHLYHFLAF